MKSVLDKFVHTVACGDIEIYNEFSLQHELGIHLRNYFPGMKVQFERNVLDLFGTTAPFIKREIDISILSADKVHKHSVLELKFPRSGQHPEQMFKFCQDIAFVEQLKKAGFQHGYFLGFVDDKVFCEGREKTGIYPYFRDGKLLTGTVYKPTGKGKDVEKVEISGSYKVKWESVPGTNMRYVFLEI